ncbi:methyltransferase [uncultured Flavobacterium sp.]|uniref:methyltransferase n=1 Tax=uncultured Flavobacterium sp. TaxID=165435 RepID=UPI0030EC2039|tara:strand:+ start:82525 stop:83193 length:669 start_codon:yes stop_codon:yes gene_type:complete
MREFIKKITHPFLKLGLKLFYFKPRKYCYEDICIKVHPNVFPPHLTLSTKILLDFIKPIELENKTVLELGCGSGIISLLASKKGANVLASDINKTALKFLNENAEKNKLSVTTIYSDLFDSIENSTFDFIIINPPYYPKSPKNIKEQAWFCGENFEYFESLFSQLLNYKKTSNSIYMILSEDCDLERIKAIAKKNNLSMKCVAQKSVIKEINYIFIIDKIES